MKKTKFEYSIVLLRIASMGMIITAHFMQFYDDGVGWWFYGGMVAVVVFMAISGFLYGGHDITNPAGFLLNCFKKILLPYYIYLLIMIPLYLIFAPGFITWQSVLGAITCTGTIAGLGHLWFVRCILICYLLTPLLYLVSKLLMRIRPPLLIVIILAALLCAPAYASQRWAPHTVFPTYMYYAAYAMAFFLRRLLDRETEFTLGRLCAVMVPIGALMAAVFAALIHSVLHSTELAARLYAVFQDGFSTVCEYITYAFAFSSGLTLFFGAHTLLRRLDYDAAPGFQDALRIANRYIYPVFIVHHLFIMGPAPFNVTYMNAQLAVRLTLLLSLLCAFVLEKLSALADRTLFGRGKKTGAGDCPKPLSKEEH